MVGIGNTRIFTTSLNVAGHAAPFHLAYKWRICDGQFVMMAPRRVLLRLWNVVRSGAAERELEREMAAHLALLVEEFQRRGRWGPENYAAPTRGRRPSPLSRSRG
jgi:hypothetical protein